MGVNIVEVVLRDGLQDEDVIVSTEDKVSLANVLVDAGVKELEVASFVNPKKVPQMADGDAVVAGTSGLGAVRLGLALNGRGVDRAADSGVEIIQVSASASTKHSLANAGQEPVNAVDELKATIGRHPGQRFIAGIAMSFVSPWEGEIPSNLIVDMIGSVLETSIERINLADTIGVAEPAKVASTIGAVREAFPTLQIGVHLHNAHGRALESVDAALDLGVEYFDSALGGFGGCPFAPDSAGNLATEELIAHLATRGVDTGLDPEKLGAAARLVNEALLRGAPIAVSH